MRSALSCLAVSVMFLGVGCAPPSVEPPASAKPASTQAPAKVDLPAMIPLTDSLPPEMNPDGTARVSGLLTRRGKYMQKKVIVKGYVVDKYTCPRKAKTCQPPHLWVADTPAGEGRKLLVVNVEDRFVQRAKIGAMLSLSGKFTDRSEDGFVRSAGLLLFEQKSDAGSGEQTQAN